MAIRIRPTQKPADRNDLQNRGNIQIDTKNKPTQANLSSENKTG
jgi:hypothetical protein